MKPSAFLTVIILFLCLVTGCRKSSLPKESQAPIEPVVNAVTSEELAQVILKPKPLDIQVPRDPFRPLFSQVGSDGSVRSPIAGEMDIAYVGVIKIGEEYFALLRYGDKKGVFKLNDQINSLKITEIREDYVMLQHDQQSIKIKRGEQP